MKDVYIVGHIYAMHGFLMLIQGLVSLRLASEIIQLVSRYRLPLGSEFKQSTHR